jgi:DNA gyrase subunit A
LTPLQQTFGVSLLALVADEHGRLEPRLLSLKRLLMHYVEHRQEVIVRRSRYDLERAKQRGHILEGLLRALDVLDEIIALIRGSKTADIARQGLIQKFNFTELQAQAILDMQLRRLAALERQKLKDEYKQILALIKELEALLKSPKKVLARIQDDLVDLKARYADPRRTQIADRVQGILTTHDLLPDEEVWVTFAADGALARHPVAASASAYPFQSAASLPPLRANTRDDLYLFSAKGQTTRVSIHQIPEAGSHFAELTGFGRRDRVIAMCALPKPDGEMPASGFQLLGTTLGKVKRVALADSSPGSPQKTRDFAGQGLLDQAATNPQVIGLDEGDELLWADVSRGGGEILLITAQGQAIRFPEDDVRAMGLPAGGVAGIKLAAKDHVIAGMALGERGSRGAGEQGSKGAGEQGSLVLVTTACYAKRVPLADFPAQSRGGQGVIALKPTPRLGEIAAAALCSTRDQLVFRMGGGKTRVVSAADVPEQGRPAQGKFLAELAVGTPVEGMVVVAAEREEELEAGMKAEIKAKAEVKAKKPAESAPLVTKAPTAKPARGKAKMETDKPAPTVGAIPPRSPVPEPATKPARGKANAKAAPSAPTVGVIPPRSPTPEPAARPARGKAKTKTAVEQPPLIPSVPPTPPVKLSRNRTKDEAATMAEKPAAKATATEPTAKPVRRTTKVATEK